MLSLLQRGMESRERATVLANQALELVASGRDEDASRALREAASLAPENPHVKAAFDKIRVNDLQHLLHTLCSKFLLENDDNAGREALRYLDASAEVPADVAKECMELVGKPRAVKNKGLQDSIIEGLLRESIAARAWLAKALRTCKTDSAFMEIYEIGDCAADGISAVVLDPALWNMQDSRDKVEEEIFQLFLARLLEVGVDQHERALRNIAKLLIKDTEKLHSLIDEPVFDAIVSCLDNRNSADVRKYATLATAKYLEVAGRVGEQRLEKFVATRVTQQRNEDLVLAFSAAAGIFPAAPSIISAYFLTQGFVEGLVPLLDKKAKSEKVEQAALDMLSAACIDSACRGAISKNCTEWLQNVLKTRTDQRASLAAVILVKVLGPPGSNNKQGGDDIMNELVSKLMGVMIEDDEDRRQSAIEGIAFASVQPNVKEILAQDTAYLTSLLHILQRNQKGSSIAFGALTIVDNMTRYRPNLSEEQSRISQLKAYANASKMPEQADPLDADAAVSKRCEAIVKADIISGLVGIRKTLSPASISLVCNILLSLSRNRVLRGTISQQGGTKLLLEIYMSVNGTSVTDAQCRRTVAHALARILITVDASLVFTSSGSVPLSSTVRPLVSLLTEDPALPSEGPRDLMPTFEAILALTNLAGLPSSGIPEAIISTAFPTIEDLLLNNKAAIRREATGLVCNLVNNSTTLIELYADGSKAADRRIHVLLAMADVDDRATRTHAGGALAVLTEYEGAARSIIARERGLEIILALCEDDDQEIVRRGVACLMNLLHVDGDAGEKAVEKVKELRGLDILRAVSQTSKIDDAVMSAKEALERLQM